MLTITSENITNVILPRPSQSHKGNYGRVALIGGIPQYAGAIVLSALACVSSGAGLTTVISHPSTIHALHAQVPEAMFVAWNDTATVQSAITEADVIVIGSGLGITNQSKRILHAVLEQITDKQWLIVDGSALTLYATEPFDLPCPERTIFTPHEMEWQRVSHIPIANQTDVENQKIQQKLGTHIVLKSAHTRIYGVTTSYKNPGGHPAMATGGMGDTLAGMIGAFIAQFKKNEQTIAAAVYVHSFIAEELAKTNYVILPTVLSKQIPYWMQHFSALKTIEKGQKYE